MQELPKRQPGSLREARSPGLANMGRIRRSRTHSNPKKNQAPGQKTRRYKRDIDQIHEDVLDGGARKKATELLHKDLEDLPGMQEHECLPCSRYFTRAEALETHMSTKLHKRRMKLLQEKPYSIEESMQAAGMGVDNKQRRPEDTLEKTKEVEMAA